MDKAGIGRKTRSFEISLLNVFFCLLVIFIHVSSSTVSALDKNSWQYVVVMIPWRLSAFVVQGFIVLSGVKLFLHQSKRLQYASFIKNRLLLIVVPYMVWVFIYYLYFWDRNYFPFQLADLWKYMIAGNLVSHFYFVIIILQFYIGTPLWMKLIKKTNPTVLIIFSLMATLIVGQNLPSIIKLIFPAFDFRYTDRVFTTYFVYWIAGCYIGLYYDRFKEILHSNKRLITVVFIVCSCSNAFLSYLNFTGKQYIYWLENVHMMYCMSAILFFYMIADQIKDIQAFPLKRLLMGFVNRIDKLTYGIYLAHCLVIFLVNEYVNGQFTDITMGASYCLRIVAVYTFVIGGALLLNKGKELILFRFIPHKKKE